MQLFNLIKKIRLTILNLLLISGFAFSSEPIGDIRESIGYGGITRDKEIYNLNFQTTNYQEFKKVADKIW